MPPGLRVYAIGDIHGRSDLLRELLSTIEADRAAHFVKRSLFVFLGDYIDRGPASAEVVDQLVAIQKSGTVEAHFLMGNHEEVLLRILNGDVAIVPDWLRFGGRECLASYGLDATAFAILPPSEMIGKLKAAMPRRHRDFLGGLSDTVRVGDYLFVHAGLRPGFALSAQSQDDMRWIRSPFLEDSEADFGFMVVHGHTIVSDVELKRNRIGIDTGAYQTGRLTALVLEGAGHRILQTGK